MSTEEKEGFFKRIEEYLKNHPLQSIWNVMGLIGLIVATAHPGSIWELCKLLFASLVLGVDWLKENVPPAFHAIVDRARRTLLWLVVGLVLIPLAIYLMTAFIPANPILATINLIGILWSGLGTLFLALVISAAVLILEKGLVALPIVGKRFQYQPGAKKLSGTITEVGVYALTFAVLFGIFHEQMQVWSWSVKIIAFLSFLLLVCTVPKKVVRRWGVAISFAIFLITVLFWGGKGAVSATPQPVKDWAISGMNETLEHRRIFGDYVGAFKITKEDADYLQRAFDGQQRLPDGTVIFPLMPGDANVTGDMNGDGRFTSDDAKYLRAYVEKDESKKGPAPVKRESAVKVTVATIPVMKGTSMESATISTNGPIAAVTLDTRTPFWAKYDSLYFPAGTTVEFEATGTFVWDPAVPQREVGPAGAGWLAQSVSRPDQFPVPDAPIVCLIGRIGDQVFPIGQGCRITVARGGHLELGLNERWQETSWEDNRGTISIKTKIVS